MLPAALELTRKDQAPLTQLQSSPAATSEGEPDDFSKDFSYGKTNMFGCSNNLIKNIVGSGVLCLAGGVAAFTDQPKMLAVAVGIALVFAALAGYCFNFVAATCRLTGARSYTEAWAKTVGENTAWIPNLIVVFKTWSACLIYSMIIGDLLTDLAVTFGISAFCGVPVTRTSIIVACHAFGLLPLCLLRSFSVLSYASVLGIGGLLYTMFFMIVRAAGGSYAPGGEFFAKLVAAGGKGFAVSSFNVMGTSPIKSLILISMLTNSYLCHYNAPKFLAELKNSTAQRFNRLVGISFFGAFLMNAAFMMAGFLAFGGCSQGLILNNYSTSDTLATLSRGAIGASILLGYPLTFEGFRTAFLEFFKVEKPTQKFKDGIVFAFIASVCLGACLLSDLGVVVSFLGALLGSFVIYVFPSLMYRGALEQKIKRTGGKLTTSYYTSGALIGVGTFLGFLGAAVVLLRACTNVLG